jgi:hypothetical protein
MLGVVDAPASSLRFAQAARRLGAAARAAGLTVPAFRCPPRTPDVARTIRRYPGGTVVSVRMKGRAFPAVVDDMVDGVLVANRVEGEAADRLRVSLRAAIDGAPAPGAEAA